MSVRTIRLPGRVYDRFADMAMTRIGGPDEDVADALSRPGLKRRGGGFTVYVKVSDDQLARLAEWVPDDAPKLLRDYRQAMREAARCAS